MKELGTIMRKELYRVFSDKKLILGLYVMPAAVVLGLYLLMGIMAASMVQDMAAHEPTVLICQAPDSFRDYMGSLKAEDDSHDCYEAEGVRFHISWTEDAGELEAGKDRIYAGELDLILEFPEDFDLQAETYTEGGHIPDIYTFYNPSEDYSDNARADFLSGVMEPYRRTLLEKRIGDLAQLEVFTIDEGNEASVIQNDNKAQGKMFGYIIPYMITILLFAGAMNLGTDSFAGEKERGTMAALLMTPVKRSRIVYGKLIALMILSGLSALIYGGSMIFALPLLYRTLGAMLGQSLSFTVGQMGMLLVLIVTLVFSYVALIALCSTFAKNMKEANTYIMPVYMVVMAIGVVSMFRGEDTSNLQYLIPLYGPTMALKNIFTLDITAPGFLLATLSNLGSGAVFAWATARMFRSEKIMFNA